MDVLSNTLSILHKQNMADKKIIIDASLCDGCGICMSVCPMGCLEMNEDKVVLGRDEDCLICQTCEAECRRGAIRVST